MALPLAPNWGDTDSRPSDPRHGVVPPDFLGQNRRRPAPRFRARKTHKSGRNPRKKTKAVTVKLSGLAYTDDAVGHWNIYVWPRRIKSVRFVQGKQNAIFSISRGLTLHRTVAHTSWSTVVTASVWRVNFRKRHKAGDFYIPDNSIHNNIIIITNNSEFLNVMFFRLTSAPKTSKASFI